MVTAKARQDDEKRNSFYFAMALVFALAAVIGFAPNSIAILNGTKENPPLLIHLHAASMSLWMALLVRQSGLAGRGQIRLHMALGQASFLLAPTVLLLIVAIAHGSSPTRPPLTEHPARKQSARIPSMVHNDAKAVCSAQTFETLIENCRVSVPHRCGVEFNKYVPESRCKNFFASSLNPPVALPSAPELATSGASLRC